MSVAYSAAVAVGIPVAYLAVIVAPWRISRVRDAAIFTSRRAFTPNIIGLIGLGAVLLAVATTWRRWWHSVLLKTTRWGGWTLIVSAMFGGSALHGARQIDCTSPKAHVLPLIPVAVLIAGFAEEVATGGC